MQVVVDAALEELPELMAAGREAATDGDAAGLQMAAHKLKGAIRYFGDSPAFNLAYKLETMGRDGNLEHAGGMLPSLDGAMSRLTAALSDFER